MFLEISGNFTNVISRPGKFLKINNILKDHGNFCSQYKSEKNFLWLGTIILSVITVKL